MNALRQSEEAIALTARLLGCLCLLTGMLTAGASGQGCNIEPGALSPTGEFPNNQAIDPSLSDDGLRVCFVSLASNLVPGTGVGEAHVYVFDRWTSTVQKVSIASDGTPANHMSALARISGDGRYVAFMSQANNLVPGLAQISRHVYIRDLVANATELVSCSSAGVPGNSGSFISSVSRGGRWIAFESEATNLTHDALTPGAHCFLRDRVTGQTSLLSKSPAGGSGSSSSLAPAISADGSAVAFASSSTNLLQAPLVNARRQIFVCDVATGTIRLGSVAFSGGPANDDCNVASLSADGRWLAFQSPASNLAPGDTNGADDVFVRDLIAGVTVVASVPSQSGVSPVGHGVAPRMSAAGTHVVFESLSSQLAPNDLNNGRDVFVHNLLDRSTRLVSLTYICNPAGGSMPAVSLDGRSVAFVSGGAVLPGHGSQWADVFVRDMEPRSGVYCTAKLSSNGCLPSIGSVGLASVDQPDRFFIGARSVRSSVNGLLFYGVDGGTVSPLGGGVLCVASPSVRTAVQNSGGEAPGPNCTGAFTFDFNEHIQSGADPALTSGVGVWCQFWGRDPGYPAPFHVTLSDGLHFTIR